MNGPSRVQFLAWLGDVDREQLATLAAPAGEQAGLVAAVCVPVDAETLATLGNRGARGDATGQPYVQLAIRSVYRRPALSAPWLLRGPREAFAVLRDDLGVEILGTFDDRERGDT